MKLMNENHSRVSPSHITDYTETHVSMIISKKYNNIVHKHV